MATSASARAGLLIAPRELAAVLGVTEGPPPARPFAAPPLIVDTRPAESFAEGHLPGAIHLDLWGFSLIDTDEAPRRAFLWMIHHVLEQRGINADRPVVVYEDTSGIRAARVFWFLEYFGHPDTRVLDGGLSAWLDARLPVTRDATPPKAAEWKAAPRLAAAAGWKDVALSLDSPDAVMLDTRSDDEYTGRVARAKRGGAIPGAVHVEWTRNLAADGSFKPDDDLRAMYEAAGVTPDREVITYCQGGYRAAHGYLALRLLGYPRVRNYLGSWKEWGDREDLPIETKD
ncbi:MAG TPA: sulfurtransferase [Vicinamibacterales bacterium]|nr:sulfurtransferase [Vicinamibacterales bacterium]